MVMIVIVEVTSTKKEQQTTHPRFLMVRAKMSTENLIGEVGFLKIIYFKNLSCHFIVFTFSHSFLKLEFDLSRIHPPHNLLKFSVDKQMHNLALELFQ